MNIITIDPSLTCTAMIVNGKAFVYAADNIVYTKTGKMTKWFDLVDPFIHSLRVHSNASTGSYADVELQKLNNYSVISYSIVEDILANLNPGMDSKVYIEGYSFSSAAGPLIDLVTFGTLVRSKIHREVTPDIRVVAPTELKMFAAKFTYPTVTGKKNETIRNNDGVAGGKFKKPEMYKALTENPNLQCDWVNFLRNLPADDPCRSKVPKPIEDLNDAKLMFEIAKSNKYF